MSSDDINFLKMSDQCCSDPILQRCLANFVLIVVQIFKKLFASSVFDKDLWCTKWRGKAPCGPVI